MSEDRKKENGTVVRVVKNKDYTVMNNTHLKSKELSLKAKGLMSICLSLPDEWEYSVAGLMTLSSDGRDSVTSALKTLEKYGFLSITKERTEKGFFKSIYTFYENPNENKNTQSITENPLRISRSGLSETDERLQFSRSSLTAAENLEQLNTDKKELKSNTQIPLLENQIFKPIDLFNLYLEICKHFPQPQEMTPGREKKAKARIKKRPQQEFWEKVFNNAEKSKLLRDGDLKWFCFDWVLKNDNNPLKVYEGNYGGGYENEIAAKKMKVFQGDKYANIYGKGA